MHRPARQKFLDKYPASPAASRDVKDSLGVYQQLADAKAVKFHGKWMPPDQIDVTTKQWTQAAEPALAAYKAGNFKDALDAAKAILVMDGQNPDAQTLAGLAAYQAKNYGVARRYFTALAESDPANGLAQNNLAVVSTQQKQIGESLIHYTKALQLIATNRLLLDNIAEAMNSYKKSSADQNAVNIRTLSSAYHDRRSSHGGTNGQAGGCTGFGSTWATKEDIAAAGKNVQTIRAQMAQLDSQYKSNQDAITALDARIKQATADEEKPPPTSLQVTAGQMQVTRTTVNMNNSQFQYQTQYQADLAQQNYNSAKDRKDALVNQKAPLLSRQKDFFAQADTLKSQLANAENPFTGEQHIMELGESETPPATAPRQNSHLHSVRECLSISYIMTGEGFVKIRRWWQLNAVLFTLLLWAASLFAQFENPFDPPASAPAPVRRPAAVQPPITAVTLTDEQVVASKKHGIDYLLSAKRGNNWEIGPGDGGWSGPSPDQRGGETSLVLYALLHAGQSLQDDPDYGPKLNPHGKELAPVIEALCKLNPDQTYSAALMANALAMLPIKPGEKDGKTLQDALRRASNYLITAIGPRGGYTYAKAPPRSTEGDFRGDLSNSQYAALGMWALEEAGLTAPNGYWQVTDRLWRTTQLPSGSWPYSANAGPAALQRDTMGVAGIATLTLAQEYLDKQLRSTPLIDKNLELALAWLDVNFKPDSGDLYYMYGIERVGMANGLKFIGSTDWYRACAAEIISHQQPDGAWDTRSWVPGFQGTTPTTATSFALLFLARGRNPVLFNKLQYDGGGGGGGWNAARPRRTMPS